MRGPNGPNGRRCILAAALAALLAAGLAIPACSGVAVAGVSLDQGQMDMAVGDSAQLAATIRPSDAANWAVSWSSSNPAVASVSGRGLAATVTAASAGAATITVTSQDGGRTAECRVAVANVPAAGVALSPGAMGLGCGIPEQLTAVFQPGNATDKAVDWHSSNMAVATVVGSGETVTINPLSAGRTTITAIAQDGGWTATCAVTVSDVYIVGHEHGNSDRARAWHNDVLQVLSNESDSSARSVFVSGGNVHAAGIVGFDSAAYTWTNGVRHRLAGVPSGANSIFVSGNNVHVAGREGFGMNARATLWKNDVAQRLSSVQSHATSVFVSGGSVYAVGFENDRVGRATLWKNGAAQRLSDVESGAASVFVSGGDAYVAGYTEDNGHRATLWTNGAAQRLSDVESYARSVFVSDGDVYVAGDESGCATLWKNGAAQRLGDAGSYANSVFVLGGGVYVVGSVSGTGYNRYATLWKNGVARRLSNGSPISEAYGVFVK